MLTIVRVNYIFIQPAPGEQRSDQLSTQLNAG